MLKLDQHFLAVFPDLADKPAMAIDLEGMARGLERKDGTSPFLDPGLTNKFLKIVHRAEGAAYSFGGYLKHRYDLWKGSYLEEENSVHLGIDINAPAGTAVAVAHPSRVAKVIHDTQQFGWGSVIVFELEKPLGRITHFLYAHLSKDDIFLKPGDRAEPGVPVARLGKPHENGGWYEHLHVQAMTAEAWGMMKDRDDMAAFDGYGAYWDEGEHPVFPDPMPLLIR